MEHVTKKDFLENIDFYASEIEAGKIFIYPTDTLFGIGCDATNKAAVEKIYAIKKRNDTKSLLCMAPNLQWIADNCVLNILAKKQMLEKLPGPFSFIVNLKNKKAVADNLSQHWDTIWVRIPAGWFNKVISYLGKPFISTSVNFTGEPPATSVDSINPAILEQVDYLITSSKDQLSWHGSTIIDVTWDEPKILRQ